jgi:hypothetical protein
MPITDDEIRDLFSRRKNEFGKECTVKAIVVLVAQELQVPRDRVWHAALTLGWSSRADSATASASTSGRRPRSTIKDARA